MKIESLKNEQGVEFEGLLLITPEKFTDQRGFFFESWNQKTFDKQTNSKTSFVQDNHSRSSKGVLRGLHYQLPPHSQGKLVRVISGEVFDVAVDIRKGSPTFGEWASIVLSKANKLMIWIPTGFAHGFLSLKNESEIIYKATMNYCKSHERTIRWNDDYLNIKWPLNKINNLEPVLSEKDSNAPYLKNAHIFD